MHAPICGGRPGFRHRPTHAKRHGFSRFHSILLHLLFDSRWTRRACRTDVWSSRCST